MGLLIKAIVDLWTLSTSSVKNAQNAIKRCYIIALMLSARIASYYVRTVSRQIKFIKSINVYIFFLYLAIMIYGTLKEIYNNL